MFHKILEQTEKEPCPQLETEEVLENIQRSLFSRLSPESVSIINFGESESRVIQNKKVIIPQPVLTMMMKIGGSGVVSDDYRCTQTAIANLQNGEKEAWGIMGWLRRGFCIRKIYTRIFVRFDESY